MSIRKDHPLMKGEAIASHIESWRDWLKLWNENSSCEVRHSLLHVGLDVPVRGETWDRETGEIVEAECFSDRVLFYLSVADGWNDIDNFEFPNSDRWMRGQKSWTGEEPFSDLSPARKRQRLAAKAFSMLFSALFKPSDKERSRRGHYDGLLHWRRMFKREIVALLHFFRICRGRACRRELRNLHGPLYNLPEVKKHLLVRVERFLVEFITFLWKDYEPAKSIYFKYRDEEDLSKEERAKKEKEDRFNAEQEAFARALERYRYVLALMLVHLGESDLLWSLPMDERVLARLHRFAMRARVATKKHAGAGNFESLQRPVQSLEEVLRFARDWNDRLVVRGSVAKFLLLHKAHREAERQKQAFDKPELDKAERASRRAAQRERKRKAEALRRRAEELEGGD